MPHSVISRANLDDGCILEMSYNDYHFAGFKPVTNIIEITYLTPDGEVDEKGVQGYNCNNSEYHTDQITAIKAFDERFKNAEKGKFGCSRYAKPLDEILEKEKTSFRPL